LDSYLQEEQSIWLRYHSEPTQEVKNVIISKYEPFACMLAAKLYANRQIKEIEFDEFKHYALIGLIEAIDKFDFTMSVSFKTYSSHRIKGAILDGIEKYSEKQQQIAVHYRLREERMKNILDEVALVKSDIFSKLVDIAVGTAIGFMLEDTGMYQEQEREVACTAYQSSELSDLARIMERLVCTLPEQEEKVIRLHYYHQKRFDSIAEAMQLSKGRISQIHHRALRRLHEHYDELKILRGEY
jgi:RNA polymerase sigma factor FliA